MATNTHSEDVILIALAKMVARASLNVTLYVHVHCLSSFLLSVHAPVFFAP